MRILIAFTLLLCAVNGFRLNELRPLSRVNASPRSECIGVPNGTQLPVPNDCQAFILCENNSGLTLRCRTSHPHFDRCNGRCVEDITVCFITSCNGEPTVPPPTDPPTPPTVPTVPPEETEPPLETTTTTVFVVPTVPS